MVTAFVDMVGLLMVLPLLPFYAGRLLSTGVSARALDALGLGGEGVAVALLVASFSLAQLASAPFWGRISDRYGRRPTMLIGLGAAAAAYVVFAYAGSLDWLFLSRIVQGAGGGTVGVIQAYVADSTEPKDRAKALGWLSAATNLGVALGPVIGSWAAALGPRAPGLIAAGVSLVNMGFVYRYLAESRDASHAAGTVRPSSRAAVFGVLAHPARASSRLILVYAITMGAFQGMTAIFALFLADRFAVTERTIGYFFMYIGTLSVGIRALLLGRMVDRYGEARLSRIGVVLLAAGLAAFPMAPTIPALALATALMPLGTAFTFPCVTGLLSRVVGAHERGLYMGVQQSYGGIARVVGPLWAGFAFDHLGRGFPFWTAAAAALCTLALSGGFEGYAKSGG
jgi:MFS family permease